MERKLGVGGIKWVKTKINSNFSVEIEPKKIELKLKGVNRKKNLKFE